MSNHRITVAFPMLGRITLLPIALVALLTASEFLSARTPTASNEADATVNMRPGSVFRDKLRCSGKGPEMVVIPAGRFLMGDLNGGGDLDEKPVHEVRIAKPFAMARYEVTFAEYDRFAEATSRSKPEDEGWGRGKRPVINVSWENAQAYAEWFSQQTGKQYRLPTDAEWEYAARAGSVTTYFWGDYPSGRHANVDEEDGWPEDGYENTAPVGSFLPNRFGLYDMSGNVWEWTEDCWHENYEGAPTDGSAWVNGGRCSFRILRGGSFRNSPAGVRSANHIGYKAFLYSLRIGFRLARTL